MGPCDSYVPRRSTKPSESDEPPCLSKKIYISARPKQSNTTPGSAQASSTQGVLSIALSASNANGDRAQKLPADCLFTSNTEPFESFEEDTLDDLSGSRSSLRHRGSSKNAPPRSGYILAAILVNPPSIKSGSPAHSCGYALPAKLPFSKVEFFVKASKVSDGSISRTSDARLPKMLCFCQLITTVWLHPGYPEIDGFLDTAIVYPG